MAVRLFPRRLTRTLASRRASSSAGCAGRGAKLAALLCGALFFPGSVPVVHAQSEAELSAAAARLASSTLQPLPDSALNRDIGQVAVIEWDGSSYDKRLPDGSPNFEARTRVGRKFYETHRDDYDFLVVLTNFEFDTGGATAFHLFGRNEVQGNGKPVGSTGPNVFGSPSRLKGWIDMAAVSRYDRPPLSTQPGGAGFLGTLDVLAHELGHQWLAEARFIDAQGRLSSDLLGDEEAHWSYLLGSDASLYYGAEWREDAPGTYSAVRVRRRYSPLDLYLMGFLPPDKVPALTLLRNESVDRHGIVREGDQVAATPERVTIEQLTAAMGPRRPDWRTSQKDFRVGFVFLARPGSEPTPDDLEAVERIRRAFGAHFFALTRGVAWADTALATAPAAAQSAAPDLDRAAAWLQAAQGLDGVWVDSAETRVRDTAAALRALFLAGATGPDFLRGLGWLQVVRPESLDAQSRAAVALAAASLPAAQRQERLAAILAAQNGDGGFGAGGDFASDALDTALALRAMKALGQPADPRVAQALATLQSLSNPDGGWPSVHGGETSTLVTAEVLLAVQDWRDLPGAAPLESSALAALMMHRNPDGGFGTSPSTPHATALVLQALLRAGPAPEVTSAATEWLERSQLADGSWNGSAYQTALVLEGLRSSLSGNLVVPADSLVIEPNPVREGMAAHVSARVRNAGRVAAPATLARLFDGDPGGAPAVGEQPVPALGPGEEAPIAFEYETSNRAGTHTLYVVADAAGSARESREDDNAAIRQLRVEGPLPDLVVSPPDILVSLSLPAPGEESRLVVTVRNTGERASAACLVTLSVSDAFGAAAPARQAMLVPLEPGATAAVAFDWTPETEGLHRVRAVADARFAVSESDETNNAAERSIPVTDAPDRADLALSDATATPSRLRFVPQQVDLRVVAQNLGREEVASVVRVYADESREVVLGETPIALAARESRTVDVRVTVTSGVARTLLLVADPDWQVWEADEGNNTTTVTLADDGTTDLELVDGTATMPAEVAQGDPVSVEVAVHNRGTRPVLRVPVQAADETTGRELARTEVALESGETKSVSLAWVATVAEDDLRVLVRADPFDLVREEREDNNATTLHLRVLGSALPNLAITGADMRLAPDPLVEGEPATVAASVRNTGGGPASAFVVRFFVGDPDDGGTLVGESTVPGLEAGAAADASVPWPRVNVHGSLGLFVVVDADGTVRETDESDNRAFRPFRSTGLPDLVLVPADVVLEPGYPREGESVSVRLTVRNLGERPSVEATASLAEGKTSAETVIGTLVVPPLLPGAFTTLSFDWSPAAPPGDRRLFATVDPEGRVVESDEGNNEVRRKVVVQNADLYLTEPYFSPNGDGVKDETTLSWRATGAVTAVVANARGAFVRTLVEDGPASGSTTWDGRDASGRIAWDGRYTLTLLGEGSRVIGEVAVELDTNRSAIHDSMPSQRIVRNLSCALPGSGIDGPQWLPGDDAVLFLVREASPGFPVGLVRVELDGSHRYVVQDPWFSTVTFPSTPAVSPDGVEVLVQQGYEGLHAVSLVTGAHRSLGSGTSDAVSWSPDGRFIVKGREVIGRDGVLVSTLDWGTWFWSPGSDRLARGLHIRGRDGSVVADLPPENLNCVQWTTWRPDGKILTVAVEDCETGDWPQYLVDPVARTAVRMTSWNEWQAPAWSPDGSRFISPSTGDIRLADGTTVGRLVSDAKPSPGGAAVSYRSTGSNPARPGAVCSNRYEDVFALSTTANLTANLDVAYLPANKGLLLRGTASDRNLEHYRLEFATHAEPDVWRPIGPAFDSSVVEGELVSWVPPGPGTYVVRLVVADRAGNSKVRVRTVSWDRVPRLANFTQSEAYVSPNGDGVKDDVTFRYLVLEPTRLDARIVGPQPADSSAGPGPLVRRFSLEYPAVGPQELAWDGRDESGRVVPDGRYTVLLDDVPFTVEVDNTPPEIGMRFEGLRAALAKVTGDWPRRVGDDCRVYGLSPPVLDPTADQSGSRLRQPELALSSIAADRVWHVVDGALEGWKVSAGSHVLDRGSEGVFVDDADASAWPVLEGTRPGVRREDGRPAGRRDFELVSRYLRFTDLVLEATDLAGNVSRVAVDPLEEALVPLGAESRCKVLTPVLGPGVAALEPEKVTIQVGATLRNQLPRQGLRLAVQPDAGGSWTELPFEPYDWGGHRSVSIDSFAAAGLDPIGTYRGVVRGTGEGGEILSPEFRFSPCEQWIDALQVGRRVAGVDYYYVLVRAHLATPLASVTAQQWREDPLGTLTPGYAADLHPVSAQQVLEWFKRDFSGDALFLADWPKPEASCADRLRILVRGRDTLGNEYPDPNRLSESCQRLMIRSPETCGSMVDLEQTFPGCSGSPDFVHVRAKWFTELPARVTVEAGPATYPTVIDSFVYEPTVSRSGDRTYAIPVRGEADGPYPVAAHLVPVDPALEPLRADVAHTVTVDRTPPRGQVLLPPENGSVCTGATGSLATTALVDDVSPRAGVEAAWRKDGGVWVPASRVCTTDACREDPTVPTGRPFDLAWDAAALESGWYDLQLSFCDRSGNRSTAARHVLVSREPPALRVLGTLRPVFSPNGDGRLDDTVASVRLAGAVRLTAQVRRGGPGGTLVRTLFGDRPYDATDVAVTWDGRDDGGQAVADGPYAIVFSAADACGSSTSVSVPVTVDTAAPSIAITQPVALARVAGSVDVRGQATDPHLATWHLDVSCGADPWTTLEARGSPVPAGELLVRWDTSRGPPGDCRLKLVAEDEAGNASVETIVPVAVARGDRVLRLSATPDVFSPNGDGRRETARIDAELALRSGVSLEVRDPSGTTVRRFDQAVERDAGPWFVAWDGRNDVGVAAPDGDYVAWLRAEDPASPSISEETSVGLVLDRTAPALAVTRPAEGAVVAAASDVVGSVDDTHLLQYRIEALSAPGLELGRGVEPRSDAVLASLANLADGSHTLVLSASDRAENEARRQVSFVVDSRPPRATIQSPAAGAIVLRGSEPVAVTGVVGDDHLRDWTLRFGAGEVPAEFTTIASGTSAGSGVALGAWDVRFVPDGLYTLSLVATDAAGKSTEARATVRLDGTPPVVVLTSVEEGGYVTAAGPLLGTAKDANLASWQLEAAPGSGAEAYRWSLLERGDASIEAGTLATWRPLPADGTYTLRLGARDKVGLESQLTRTVIVDATPPAAPGDLAVSIRRHDAGTADVRLTWRANTEPDLAGYRVYRDEGPLTTSPLDDPAFTDAARLEGRYAYSVVAVDRAGNASAPSRLVVEVDVTPPSLSFFTPAAGTSVSGVVEVKGTAFAPDDFAEYRLLVGAGAAPTSFTLLQKSSVPVAGGRLGEWLALADGPYTLALEADDTHGNTGRIVETVVVDTQPPAAPVLTDVAQPASPPDRLVPAWSPSPSTDVAGYLVYRNGGVANAGGMILGDLRGYLVSGGSYVDDALADGRHCYRVVAMDDAGNVSPPSNEVCRTLDNRPPRAVIVQPADGARFEFALSLMADTPDLDVAGIQFQLRPLGSADWQNLGSARTSAPWVATLDPSSLTFGTYELRAVATDAGGAIDPAPPSIRVVYGDTTAPPPPEGLTARVTGGDVSLTWAASTASDLSSYRVYRDGQRIADQVAAPAFVDAGRTAAVYAYGVAAVDADGNESAASASATAVVYALTLDAPPWPVVSDTVATVTGGGARPETNVQVLRDGATIGQTTSTSGGPFAVPGLPLVADGNVLVARGEDAGHNQSLPSAPVVLISNAAPGPVGSLEAAVSDHDVALTWTAAPDPDVFGYVVQRDGERLASTRPQRTYATVAATVAPWLAASPFDGNPATVWPNATLTGSWSVEFPSPVLVSAVRTRFAPSAPAASFTVEARWKDRFVPLVRVRGNALAIVEGPLPSPFATTALRVTLETPGRLAEVDVDRLDVVPADTLRYDDAGVRDGRHDYSVSAIDVYGAEGPAVEATAPVGDVDAPAPPTGLAAVVLGREVRLTWSANNEPDLAGYVVVRDGERIGSAAGTSFRDVDVANGTHAYALLAVDRAGLESPPSDTVSVRVEADPATPAAPEILEPTTAATPIVLATSTSHVGGRAPANTAVAVEVDGEPRGSAATEPGFLLDSAQDLPARPVALSRDGTLAAYYDWSTRALTVRGLPEGPRTYAVGPIQDTLVQFAPDGTRLAYASTSGTMGVDELRLSDGAVRRLVGGYATGFAWAAASDRMAVAVQSGSARVVVVNLDTGVVTEVDSSTASHSSLSWSPDGRWIAFFRRWSPGSELHLIDPATREDVVLDFVAWDVAAPAWSSDSRRVAWTSGASGSSSVRVHDVAARAPLAQIAETGVDSLNARLSSDGAWLSFSRWSHTETSALCSLVARRLDTATSAEIAPDHECGWLGPGTHEWTAAGIVSLDGQRLERYRLEPGRFRLRDVALHPGTNRVVARATDLRSGLVSPDSEPITIDVPGTSFADLVVSPADLRAEPAMPRPGETASIRVRVQNAGDVSAEGVDVRVSAWDPAGATIVGVTAILPAVGERSSAWIEVPFVPTTAGPYRVSVSVDPYDRVPEASETNNEAAQTIEVVVGDGLVAAVSTDRTTYGPDAPVAVSVRLANPGRPFTGTVRTTVEDEAGSRLALLDERPAALDYGQSASWDLFWNTGTTWAGRYAVRVRVEAPGEAAPRASEESPFDVVGDLTLRAGLAAQPARVGVAEAVRFTPVVENLARNRPLAGGSARLTVVAEAASEPAVFEAQRGLPLLLPAVSWTGLEEWTAAVPAGRYVARLDVLSSTGATLASASTIVMVEATSARVVGTVDVRPSDVLAGASAEARATLTNAGLAEATGYAVLLEIVSGPSAQVHLTVPATVALAVGEARTLVVPLDTRGLTPGAYVVRLRGGDPLVTLDRANLRVHGVIAPPSPDAPADGARVDSAHPLLVVNDASSADTVPLRYEFQLFGDEALTQPLPGAVGVAETPSRTSWTVATALAEDATYWWRARASDGFSTSAWSAIVRFTVDAVDLPPSAPFPVSPAPGAETAERQPALTVRNGRDPEGRPLAYEFRVSDHDDMESVLVSAAGIAEGPGVTTWTSPLLLEAETTYYWSARARDEAGLVSPWTETLSFRVVAGNHAPTAPRPVHPVAGEIVRAARPELVAANAVDPDGDTLAYRFEVDTSPSLDSAALQTGEVPSGDLQTTWTPPGDLAENTVHYWCVSASDGTTTTTSTIASVFVNAVNEPPGPPTLLDPVDGRTLADAMPVLRLRNVTDPDLDILTYDFQVRDANGTVVAATSGVLAGPTETTWRVSPALGEDGDYTWVARASDGAAAGGWSTPAGFRVDAVVEPPSAPSPLLPAEGALVEERHPMLVVTNAVSPDRLALTYAFELDSLASDGTSTLVERATGVAETPDTTSWAPSTDLADGRYSWRCRAADAFQSGPWSASRRFDVLVDPAPAAPTGLRAVAGDTRVHLDWTASPEPDVLGYRVYRALQAGGAYVAVAATTLPSYEDLAASNGTTFYYVVTARDARSESPRSAEVSARPEAPVVLVAEVRLAPAILSAGCLGALPCPCLCPEWLYATLELERGRDPLSIDVASLRALGVAADANFRHVGDADADGIPDVRVRFRLRLVAPHLSLGANTVGIVGRAGGLDLAGASRIDVVAIAAEAWMTPRTLQRRSKGQDIQVRLTFAGCTDARRVSVDSIRLNGTVHVDRVVTAKPDQLTVKFDRQAVIGVLLPGASVEVRVTGMLDGQPFVAVDHVRVIE